MSKCSGSLGGRYPLLVQCGMLTFRGLRAFRIADIQSTTTCGNGDMTGVTNAL